MKLSFWGSLTQLANEIFCVIHMLIISLFFLLSVANVYMKPVESYHFLRMGEFESWVFALNETVVGFYDLLVESIE